MVRRVVVDSSANLFVAGTQDIVSVPMKVRVGEREFPDDANLDVGELIEAFSDEAAESSTSCPNIAEWTSAFAGADEIVALALTSKISGGFNSAQAAAKHYLFDHPEAKVFVLDSLTTGPELELLAQHANELAQSDMDFDDLTHELRRYASRTHLVFSLERIDNFVRNGRVSPIVAKVAGVLGVRIVGQASEEGELGVLNKARGEKRALKQLFENMETVGFVGGRVRIRHTENPKMAEALAAKIHEIWPSCDIRIGANRGLCSYYCEPGGVLVGFEG